MIFMVILKGVLRRKNLGVQRFQEMIFRSSVGPRNNFTAFHQNF